MIEKINELEQRIHALETRVAVLEQDNRELESALMDVSSTVEDDRSRGSDFTSYRGYYGVQVKGEDGESVMYCEKGRDGYWVINGHWELANDGTVVGKGNNIGELEEIEIHPNASFSDYNEACEYIKKVFKYRDKMGSWDDEDTPEYNALKQLPNAGYGRESNGYVLYAETEEQVPYLKRVVKDYDFPVLVIHEVIELQSGDEEEEYPF